MCAIRLTFFAVVLLMTIQATASAQSTPAIRRVPSVAGGITFPVLRNYVETNITNKEDRTRIGVSALWGEVVFPMTARGSIHAVVERASAFDAFRDYNMKSGRFRGDLRHQETTLSLLAGIRLPRDPVTLRFVGGFAFAFSRTIEEVTIHPTPHPDFPPQVIRRTESRTMLVPAVVGGVDIPIAVNSRVSIVPRLRTRATWREGTFVSGSEIPDIFTRFSFSPGVGLEASF